MNQNNNLIWERWRIDHQSLSSQDKIIDIGCGPGKLWTENPQLISENLTLLDYDENILEKCHQNPIFEKANISLGVFSLL